MLRYGIWPERCGRRAVPMKRREQSVAQRRVGLIVTVLGAMCLTVAMLLLSVKTAAFDRSFYAEEYQRLRTAQRVGMTDEDLMIATDVLLDYLVDARSDLYVELPVDGNVQPVYNEREVAHMEDVKALYLGAVYTMYALFGAFALSWLIAYTLCRCTGSQILRATIVGVGVAIGVIAIIGLLAVCNFSWFWTRFHHVFFRNDLWLLDPSTSILINMVPEAFFFALVMRILWSFICMVAAVGGACALGLWILHLRNERSKEEA